ncbi:unnamed protein product [Amoebophrya sp. A25]|nr:unnamed protein product [Amoebophrya sp. A25]|eukprot:GSA25T00026365001.1
MDAITDEQLATCEGVLSAIYTLDAEELETQCALGEDGDARGKQFKAIRRLVNQLAARSLPNKKTLDNKARKKEEKIKKAWRKQTMMAVDQKRMESVALRQGRLQAMASLCDVNEAGADELRLVPDGATFHAFDQPNVLEAVENDNGEGGISAIVEDEEVAAEQDVAEHAAAVSAPSQEEGGSSSSSSTPINIESPDQQDEPPAKKICISSSNGCGNDNNGPLTDLERPRSCYVCKAKYWKLHHFYDSLCPPCAALNFSKRFQQPKLDSSYIFLVTGGRVKIGFHTAVKLLNAGATVLVTSRFRNDTLERFVGFFGREKFFEKATTGDASSSKSIADRLILLGVDLRFLPRVEALCDYVTENFPYLNGVIHNACQTIRRPQAYYEPLREKEALMPGEVLRRQAVENGVEDLTHVNAGDFAGCGVSKSMCPTQGVFYDYGWSKIASTASLESPTKTNGCGGSESVASTPSTASSVPEESADRTNGLAQPSTSAAPSSETRIERQLDATTQAQQLLLQTKDDARVQLGSRELPGYTDVNGQLIDYRDRHSWVFKLEEVETPELVECFLINAMAPFVMNGRLKPLLEKAPHSVTADVVAGLPKPTKLRTPRFIVNVSAMEGKFYRYKTPNHPHTNMAKAALNMMTKTSAREYAQKSQIYMNSVDTGWINDEKPVKMAHAHATSQQWQTPIDEVDAAARILDPIFAFIPDVEGKRVVDMSAREDPDADGIVAGQDTGLCGPGVTSTTAGASGKAKAPAEPPYGVFLKDYRETEW